MIGTVAQWLEQVTHNLRVAGSSPAGSTNPPHFPNYRRLPGSNIKKIWNIPFLPDSKSWRLTKQKDKILPPSKTAKSS